MASYKDIERKRMFLSYNAKDSVVADKLEDLITSVTNNQIEIARYIQVPYKGSFREFMNSIQEYDAVLCIVSDNYLKSTACMYEVGEIVKDHHFEKRLHFVILNENDKKHYADAEDNFVPARIYGDSDSWIQYILFWQEKYQNLEQNLNRIKEYEARQKIISELTKIGKIYRYDINTFIEYLRDGRGISLDCLINSECKEIIDQILVKWNSRRFLSCGNYRELLTKAILELNQITCADYNQIILNVSSSGYTSELVVYADDIPKGKQRYRVVHQGGIISKAFSSGEMINAGSVKDYDEYFNAVLETRSELAYPIRINGVIVGVINSESEEENHYSYPIERNVGLLAGDLAIALKRLNHTSTVSKDEIPYIHVSINNGNQKIETED